MPGLGIVAAVLGVVLTIGKMKESLEVLEHSVGAAMLGTFLGVLLCYGFVGTLAAWMELRTKEVQAPNGWWRARRWWACPWGCRLRWRWSQPAGPFLVTTAPALTNWKGPSAVARGKQSGKVVVRRSEEEEEGHHGGSWKVAYADFLVEYNLVQVIKGEPGFADSYLAQAKTVRTPLTGKPGQPKRYPIVLGQASPRGVQARLADV